MNQEINDIDIRILRNDLCDYFGTAMTTVSGLAISELMYVENASPEELIKIALRNNFNLSDYVKGANNRYR